MTLLPPWMGTASGSIILNEFFQANTNSYNSGYIRYPYSNLEPGHHEYYRENLGYPQQFHRIKPGVQGGGFRGDVALSNCSTIPTPFSDHTLFNIEHNRPDREMKLVITIYNLSGEMVRIIEQQVYSAGYRLEPPSWDGSSAGGAKLGGGVYVYKATLSTEEGEVASESGKMIMVR